MQAGRQLDLSWMAEDERVAVEAELAEMLTYQRRTEWLRVALDAQWDAAQADRFQIGHGPEYMSGVLAGLRLASESPPEMASQDAEGWADDRWVPGGRGIAVPPREAPHRGIAPCEVRP